MLKTHLKQTFSWSWCNLLSPYSACVKPVMYPIRVSAQKALCNPNKSIIYLQIFNVTLSLSFPLGDVWGRISICRTSVYKTDPEAKSFKVLTVQPTCFRELQCFSSNSWSPLLPYAFCNEPVQFIKCIYLGINMKRNGYKSLGSVLTVGPGPW